MTLFETVSEVDGVKNIYTPSLEQEGLEELIGKKPDEETISSVIDYFNRFSEILEINDPDLIKIEKFLQETFGTSLIFADKDKKIRLANALGWGNTQLHRDAKKIILNGTEIPQHNMGKNVIDPIAWSSRTAAPSGGYNEGYPEGYGILGKILQLRPMDLENFNPKIYEEIMHTKLKLGFQGLAIESSEDELAFMPLIKIEGGENIINNYSEPRNENDIPTAKYYGLNN